MSRKFAIREGIVASLLVLIAGCAATTPVRTSPPLTEQALAARQRSRAEWMSRYEVWSFSGRAAIRKGDRGGSGRIEWEQQDRNRYRVTLSAPITRQSWQLSGDLHSGAGRIEGLSGGPRSGESAEELLLQATGLDVPLQQLGSWVRGAVAGAYPVETVVYDGQGRLLSFRQSGWDVRYTEWQAGADGRPDLPSRIEATSGDAQVKLIIEDWTFAAP